MTGDIDTATGALPVEIKEEISTLADRQADARGLFMRVVGFAGGQVEDGLNVLPDAMRKRVVDAAAAALTRSYDAAAATRSGWPIARVEGDRAHRILAGISGALGGVGGLPTALAELPVATTLIFRSLQSVAESYGEDPTDPAIRAECLRVFGAGAPGKGDDGIDTSFIGSRLTVTGPALQTLISNVAPRFAAALGPKLMAKSVPVIGALTGGAINFSFARYYTEIAHVHFGLRQLSKRHDADLVLDHFHQTLDARRLPEVKQAE